MHSYAVQITVADVRDGACSSSTLKEAASWGKVQTTHEQMVFAEATTVVPLIASDAYHRGAWKTPREAPLGEAVRAGLTLRPGAVSVVLAIEHLGDLFVIRVDVVGNLEAPSGEAESVRPPCDPPAGPAARPVCRCA